MSPTVSFIPQMVDIELYSGDGAALRLLSSTLNFGGEVVSQIRADRSDPEVLAEWTVDLDKALDGELVLTLTGEQARSLMLARTVRYVRIRGRRRLRFFGVWDVQWTDVDAEPQTLVQGDVTCDLDVTRGDEIAQVAALAGQAQSEPVRALAQ